jgi:hypothetical protein
MRGQWSILVLGAWLCGVSACEDEFQAPREGTDGAGAGGESEPIAGATSLAGMFGRAGAPEGMGGDKTGAAGEPAWPGGGGQSSTEPAGGAAGQPSGCSGIADCDVGENCVSSRCVPARVSCAAQKNSHPASEDGVYWIGTAGAWLRAYCDMQLSTELCTEVTGEHMGRTREKAAIGYTMTSVLLLNEGVCKMWAIRGTDDGHPFDQLKAVAGVAEGQTCISLGFVADGVLGACDYGTERTTCGFSATPLYWYGNNCAGCAMNDGTFDRWTLQGPAIRALALSSTSGTDFTTCKVHR